MLRRNILLAIGLLCLLGGVTLSVMWLNQMRGASVETAQHDVNPPQAILTAVREIPAGTLLGAEDIAWKEIGPGEVRAGNLMRGQVSETEFLGAIARRNFDVGEPLVASDLVKPNDRQFLAAVLKPRMRAVSIAVDAPQSASGLVRPGDIVDAILTQSFGDDADPARKSVAETILHAVRVIAVDQSLSTQTTQAPGVPVVFTAQTSIPKTVVLEVTERQAEILLVAQQIGRLQLSVLPLEGSGVASKEKAGSSAPLWASDASPALKQLSTCKASAAPPPTGGPGTATAGNTIPVACTIRRPLRSEGGQQ